MKDSTYCGAWGGRVRAVSCVAAFAACVLLTPFADAQTAATHVVRPSDITSLSDVVSVSLSPGGDTVAYTVKKPPSKWCPGQTTLALASTRADGGGHGLKFTVAGDLDPQWRPSGGAFAFIRPVSARDPVQEANDDRSCVRGGDSTHVRSALWLSPSPFVRAHALTAIEGSIKAFRWAPDGDLIAAIVVEPTELQGRAPRSMSQPTHQSALFLIDTTSGAARRVDLGKTTNVYAIAWFPDSKRLALRYGQSSRYGAQFYASRLEIIDLQGRVLKRINDNRVSYLDPAVSPDGTELLYGRFFGDRGIAPIYTIYNIATGETHEIGVHWDGSINQLIWDTSTKLTGIALIGVHTRLVSVDVRTYKVREIFRFAGQARDLTPERAGRYAYIGNTRRHPDEVWTYNRQDAKAARLTDVNPQVARWKLADIRVVHWKSSSDGTPLSGLLALPPGAAQDEPLKGLVQAHGGPLFAWQDGWQGSWEAWAQMLTSKGYAVFMPNPRGSSGRGHKFANGTIGDWGGADYRDIMDGVVFLVKKGVLDPHGLAIGGWSYGGYMSSWIAGHNDNRVKFKAAVVGAPPTDLFLMAFESDLGSEFTTAYLGDPFDNAKLYASRSPIFSARNVSIPVLIMQGSADRRVPTVNGKLFYRVLKHYGKVADMVIYPGGTHWLSASVGREDQDDVQVRVVEWLQRYLGSDRAQ